LIAIQPSTTQRYHTAFTDLGPERIFPIHTTHTDTLFTYLLFIFRAGLYRAYKRTYRECFVTVLVRHRTGTQL